MRRYECTPAISDRIRAAAIARGQTGFIHAIVQYDVFCGSRKVHSGRIKREAVHCYRRHVRWSREGIGAADGQPVRILKDGEPLVLCNS